MLFTHSEIIIWAVGSCAVPDMHCWICRKELQGDYISTRARECFEVNTSALECIGACRMRERTENG